MNDSTLKKTEPREETLQFIRAFARQYAPCLSVENLKKEIRSDRNTFSEAIC